MSENERYVLEVCESIIDYLVDKVPFPSFYVTQFITGVRELTERMNNMEDDGR